MSSSSHEFAGGNYGCASNHRHHLPKKNEGINHNEPSNKCFLEKGREENCAVLNFIFDLLSLETSERRKFIYRYMYLGNMHFHVTYIGLNFSKLEIGY